MSQLFIVAGAPGSGKSWVCERLTGVNYIPHDRTARKLVIPKITEALNSALPVVYDPTVKVSNALKTFPQGRLVVIVESEVVIRRRLAERGGEFTQGVSNRMRRMHTLARRAEFSGTSKEVLDYLTTATSSAQRNPYDKAPWPAEQSFPGQPRT